MTMIEFRRHQTLTLFAVRVRTHVHVYYIVHVESIALSITDSRDVWTSAG
jgi:hypothetical protein